MDVGKGGKEQTAAVIQTAATNPSTLVCHPDTSGFPSSRSRDSINSEENHLEVAAAANNPSSGHKCLTKRKI